MDKENLRGKPPNRPQFFCATAGYQPRCERGCFLRIMSSLAWLDSAFVDRIDGNQRVFGCNGNVDMSTLFELHFVAVFVS